MLASWVGDIIQSEGMDYPFRYIQPLLQKADFVFCNLEAPFTQHDAPFPKQFNFKVSPSLVEVLKAGNIQMVNLANNHIMDYGWDGVVETMATLNKAGIQYCGVGTNIQEARKPVILTINNIRIGFLCYSLTFPQQFWASDTSAGTCFPFQEFVYDDVRQLKKQVDWVMVSCHWGKELQELPQKYQIKLAHRFIDAGADFVFGHHPHVIQSVEFYKGKPIIYSLGNFVFSSYSENARWGMLVKVKLIANKQYHIWVYPINVYNKEVEFQPRILDGADREQFFRHLKEISRELNPQPFVISSDGKMETVINQNQQHKN